MKEARYHPFTLCSHILQHSYPVEKLSVITTSDCVAYLAAAQASRCLSTTTTTSSSSSSSTDSITSFLQFLITSKACSADTLCWIAYALTKQLARQYALSILPVHKSETEVYTVPSLFPLLAEALQATHPTPSTPLTFGCFLMIMMVMQSLPATSVHLPSILQQARLSVEDCRSYLENEAVCLTETAMEMEASLRDVRTWQWGLLSCFSRLCGLSSTLGVTVLSTVCDHLNETIILVKYFMIFKNIINIVLKHSFIHSFIHSFFF